MSLICNNCVMSNLKYIILNVQYESARTTVVYVDNILVYLDHILVYLDHILVQDFGLL